MAETITVKIGTMTYHLQAGEDEQYVRETAAIADELVQLASKRYPGVNQLTTTVLSLLNAVDAMRQAQAAESAAEAALTSAEARTEEAEADLLRVNEQFWEMKKDLLYYRNLCGVYEQKLAGVNPAADDKIQGRKKQAESDLQQSFDDLTDSR